MFTQRSLACISCIGGWLGIATVAIVLLSSSHSFAREAHKEQTEIDTEFLFGFLTGTDVGTVGEKEIESETTGHFGRGTGTYNALLHRLALELMPLPNFRLELGASNSYHNIFGLTKMNDQPQGTNSNDQQQGMDASDQRQGPGLNDQRQGTFQGLLVDARYRLFDRKRAPFGLTLEAQSQWGRIDELTGERVDQYGLGLSVLMDRELVRDRIVGVFNVLYEPQSTRVHATGDWEREALFGVGTGIMVQIWPRILIGAEARYLRHYDSLGLEEFGGQAFFLGPTVYANFGDHWRLTAAWSTQVVGRSVAGGSSFDLTNFPRHEGRLRIGFEF
jgi:hypothetical protein